MTERKKEGIFSKIFGGEKPSCCNVRIEEVTKKEEEGTTVSAPSPADPSVQCGPECACNAPSGGKGIKIMVSLLVLLAVAGVLTFKAWNGRRAASNDKVPRRHRSSLSRRQCPKPRLRWPQNLRSEWAKRRPSIMPLRGFRLSRPQMGSLR